MCFHTVVRDMPNSSLRDSPDTYEPAEARNFCKIVLLFSWAPPSWHRVCAFLKRTPAPHATLSIMRHPVKKSKKPFRKIFKKKKIEGISAHRVEIWQKI